MEVFVKSGIPEKVAMMISGHRQDQCLIGIWTGYSSHSAHIFYIQKNNENILVSGMKRQSLF